MALDQITAFLQMMQTDPQLKQQVCSANTADDVARIAMKMGYEFSGDELLRMTGQKIGSCTVTKVATPGEYN